MTFSLRFVWIVVLYPYGSFSFTLPPPPPVLAGSGPRAFPQKYQPYYSTSLEDWRDFRAKLVQNESGQQQQQQQQPSSWAHESSVIEKGSLLLSKVEGSLGCHDLRQPYFHKCVILLLEHDQEFTKGIVLNRPSNRWLSDNDIIYLHEEDDDDDDDEEEKKEKDSLPRNVDTTRDAATHTWKLFFGGDIAGMFDDNEQPLIVCLHNCTTQLGKEVSEEVLPHVLLTSHLGACQLIEAGEATPDSFVTFYGFCGWNPGQLQDEVDRGSWYTLATDSQTIWEQLQSLRMENQPTSDPRGAGLETWEALLKKINKEQENGEQQEQQQEESFSDLMLKAWASEMLCTMQKNEEEEGNGNDNPNAMNLLDDKDIFRAIQAVQGDPVGTGTMVRGSSLSASPFLLWDQMLHKSSVLIYQDTEKFSVGLLLNHPTTESFLLETPSGDTYEFPIRYGGPVTTGSEEGDKNHPSSSSSPLIWLHCSFALKGLCFGKPLQREKPDDCVWTCSLEQVTTAIDLKYAFPEEFMCIQGYTVWGKEAGGSVGGIQGQIVAGSFEKVSRDVVPSLFSTLLSQKRLTEETLDENLETAHKAWELNVPSKEEEELQETSSQADPQTVYQSTVTVSQLADQALKNWIQMFLLGDAVYNPF